MLGIAEPGIATEFGAAVEDRTSDEVVGIKLYPPLSVLKTAALMLVTLSFYQIFWFYRTARDVREGFDISLKPWKWPFATLFALAAAIAGRNLADRLESWALEVSAPRARFFDPLVIGFAIFVLSVAAYASEPLSNDWLFFSGALGLSIPFLLMQHQLNLIKDRYDPSVFRTAANRYTGKQIAALAVFGLIGALSVAIFAFDAWQRRSAEEVGVGEVFSDDQSGFQVSIQDADWSSVDPGYLSYESAMEFLGPDEFTWAAVFSYPNTALDAVMDTRIGIVTSEYHGASCTQSKSLAENGMDVVGLIYCTGSDFASDEFAYVSRTLASADRAAEILGFTSEYPKGVFSTKVARIEKFVKGLELIP